MREEPYSSAKYRASDGSVRIRYGTPPKLEELTHPQFLSMPVTDIIDKIEETKRLGQREFWISQAVPDKWRKEFPELFRNDVMPVTYSVDQFQHVLSGIRARILGIVAEVERNLAT